MQTQLSTSVVKTKSLTWAAPLAGLAAALLNAVLFLTFSAAGIISDQLVIPDQGPITLIPVIISSIVPSLLAGLVLTLLGRFTKQPFKIFRIMALILVILSFLNPFLGIPGITLAMAVALNIMHVVVAAMDVYVFEKFARA